MPTAKNAIKFEQPSDLLILANRFILVIVAAVVLVALTIGYFFILRPSISGIKSQNTLTQESEYLQSKNQELLTRLKELKAEYEDIKNNRSHILKKLQNIIPDNPRTAELFVMADKLAKDRGLILHTIEIVDNQKNDTVVSTSTPATELATENNIPAALLPNVNLSTASSTASSLKLKSLIIHLSLAAPAPALVEEGKESKVAPPPNLVPTESTYGAFKKYLNDLEQNLRLMDIQTVAFGPLDSGLSSPIFDISLIAYYK